MAHRVDLPPQGTPMEVGTLRYGLETSGEFGETVEWRHWQVNILRDMIQSLTLTMWFRGCVTPAILNQLSTLPVENATGFNTLSPQDQAKVKLALSLHRIDPADIPNSAKASPTVVTAAGTSERPIQKKRKAEQDRLSALSAVSTQTTSYNHLILPSATQIAEDEAIEQTPGEVIDELYCTLNSNVVGIQYYKG
ncbi:hypothetical protein C0991_001651 [Blastosporella zonata]|nr:hypothetical protein C0991_001651 [Blastosporella zonata]